MGVRLITLGKTRRISQFPLGVFGVEGIVTPCLLPPPLPLCLEMPGYLKRCGARALEG